jgi:flagellin-like protein
VPAARAQSEVLGTILLVAVVVIGVSTLTAVTILDRAAVEQPDADLRTNVTDRQVVLNHTGGEPLDAGLLSVTVRDGGSEFVTRGFDGVGDQFTPGEGWTTDHGLSIEDGDRVRVVVVHDNRTVLVDAERRVYRD